MDFASLIVMTVSSALIDSFDVCAFALFLSILMSAALIDVKHAYIVGWSFIGGVYTGYLALGLVLRNLVRVLPVKLLASIMLIYGIAALVLSTRGGGRSEVVCREDDIPCRLANALNLHRLAKGVLPALVIGVIAAFTVMPCTANLYILYNIVTAPYGYSLWIPLTMLYVAVFVSPLIAILLTFIGIVRIDSVYRGIVKYEKYFKIVGALIIISAALYMLIYAIE